jgi:hypothetical protein
VCWTKAHLNKFSLSKVFHHKVLDEDFRVSATSPASYPNNILASLSGMKLKKTFPGKTTKVVVLTPEGNNGSDTYIG